MKKHNRTHKHRGGGMFDWFGTQSPEKIQKQIDAKNALIEKTLAEIGELQQKLSGAAAPAVVEAPAPAAAVEEQPKVVVGGRKRRTRRSRRRG